MQDMKASFLESVDDALQEDIEKHDSTVAFTDQDDVGEVRVRIHSFDR